VQLHGLLSLEHSGRPANSNDGSCITLLISVKVPLPSIYKLLPSIASRNNTVSEGFDLATTFFGKTGTGIENVKDS
jgi:hypothetical protein